MTNVLHTISAALVAAALGIGAGWLIRGDCAKEVRATEKTATAQAEVKAEKIATKTEVKREQRKTVRKQIEQDLNALPPDPQPPQGCPSNELGDDFRRLWNSGNQNRYLGVQPAGVDEGGPGGSPPAAGG